ncbi:hypothetical protein [Cardiobacterium hominis]|uniref:hypothetical protein n=1 Tax=Cardiobacterium hominis TaxID=2718 RepID=UPI0028D7AA28|nr:hypothetical protein [Cardiobacterium hominis]
MKKTLLALLIASSAHAAPVTLENNRLTFAQGMKTLLTKADTTPAYNPRIPNPYRSTP